MTHATMTAEVRPDVARRFYALMAVTCFAVSLIGFMPTYFIGMLQGKFSAEPVVHIHGLIVFSWMGFFCIQAWLVANGALQAHRTWGMAGIAIITAMTFTTVAIVALRITQASMPGQPDGAAQAVRAFSWVSISSVMFIVVAFVIAIAKLKQPETHKRLMLLLTISMLGAPIARWFILLLAPAGTAIQRLANGVAVANPPPAFVAIPPALLGDLLLVAAMMFDWRTCRKVHPVYLIGGGIMVLLHVTIVPVAGSDMWQSIATAIGRLGG